MTVSIIFLCLFPSFLWAKKIDVENAERVARNHTESKDSQLRNISVRSENRLTLVKSASSENNYYVFNKAEGNGFIIVSGDDVAMPVLGYSDSGNYDESAFPPAFTYWMEYLQQEIAYAIENDLQQTEKIKMAWDAYLTENSSRLSLRSGNVIVEPLIQTTWNQNPPYNNLCPKTQFPLNGLGGRTPTGCVATAMAQIMKYYNYPIRGTGASQAYQTGYNEDINVPSVEFNVDYGWDNMLDIYSGTETLAQNSAVATLMYHCGVSVRMSYWSNSSGASYRDATRSLVNHFYYDAGIQLKKRCFYEDAAWDNELKKQLDKGQPLLYGGGSFESAHSFICDGYDEDGYFHFNFGWGGSCDGYYLTTALNPGSGGTGAGNGNYSAAQEIVIDIKPDEGGLPVPGELKLENWNSSADEFSSSSQSVDRNELFSVEFIITNVGLNPSLAGTAGIALVNGNDEIVEMIYSGDFPSLFSGKSGEKRSTNATCFVSENVVPGNYKLRVMMKPPEGEWEIVTARLDGIDRLDIEVKSNIRTEYELTLYDNLSSTVVSIDRGEVFSVSMQVKNFGIKAFEGCFGIALIDNNNQIVEITGTDSGTGNVLGVDSQAPVSITSAISSAVPAGSYTLRAVERATGSTEWNFIDGNSDIIIDRLNVEVKDGIVPDGSNLRLFGQENATFIFAQNPIKREEPLEVTFTLRNDAALTGFIGEIGLGLCDTDGNLVEWIDRQILFVPQSLFLFPETRSFTFMSPRITSACDDYTMTLFQKSATGELKKVAPYSTTQYLNDIPVTIISDGDCSGIPTNIFNVEMLVSQVYPNLVKQGDNVKIVLHEELTGGILNIYDINGVLRKQLHLPETTDYQINTSDLSSGSWLLYFIGKKGYQHVEKIIVKPL
ncbi:MAG: thiol protease/hemagglutinin PrtT [Prevotellaceae bacterium]|nr:thiol protease/hemagglutinin PrtT [Prevotellaceae bacterium]